MERGKISSGIWTWDDVSIKAKIEFLKEKFPHSLDSPESKCIRTLIKFCEEHPEYGVVNKG